ncbi:MAG: hypothetical protein V4650_08465 [Pseudomonadota bacterium]
MFRQSFKTVIYISACIALSGCNPFEPKSYDDCILRYTKANQNEAAVRQIKKSCEAKYIIDRTNLTNIRRLTDNEKELLAGKGGPRMNNYFGALLHNGNNNITVTKVAIVITTISGGITEHREYETIASIPPLSSSEILFPFMAGDEGTKAKWAMIRAEGYDQ